MSTLIEMVRTTDQLVARKGSIREVRLIGRPLPQWSEGDRVAWAGRAYRVVLEQPGYVHLRSDSDNSR